MRFPQLLRVGRPGGKRTARPALLLPSGVPVFSERPREEWVTARPGHRVRDRRRRREPLSQTKTKARRPGCAHALPRRAWPARPATFSKFTCIPGRPGGRSGPGLAEPGRRAGAGRGGLGEDQPVVPARSQWAPRGGRGDSAGPVAARPLVWRCPGAECGGGLAQTRRAPGAC